MHKNNNFVKHSVYRNNIVIKQSLAGTERNYRFTFRTFTHILEHIFQTYVSYNHVVTAHDV
jgi:hypothetical protein